MNPMKPIVTWDQIELLVRGERIVELAHERIESGSVPVEELVMRFGNGELVIEGKARVGIGVPFRLVVRRIEAAGHVMRIFLEDLSAFGFLPVPRMLLQFAESRMPIEDGVSLSSSNLTIQIAIDRFLPPYVDLILEEARIVAGGVKLRLGPGGVDVPPETPGVE